MLRVDLELAWRVGGREPARFDAVLFALLEGIADRGSLRTAATRAGMSYRHAWGLLASWAETLGRPLATLERGRGTQLTALGIGLLKSRREIEARLGPELARAAADVVASLVQAGC
ncbi:MAG: LysR family transcriptional regulator [Gammaproteobacteria bacterium]|nr:LysR family transcriptional regulator [Gammaproteobacteria bacterium]